MAEIAVPLLALGGFYVVANQKKSEASADEGYTNMGQNPNALPGVVPPTPAINYPVTAKVSESNVKRYPNPNQATDKYFDQTVYQRITETNPPGSVGSGREPTMSLTGKPINKADFKHNNMVPFFGGKIKGATVSADIAESTLDNMQGSGSQMIRKQEQAPLFKPQANLQYANGAPNMSDFLQSRVNPSMRAANVKPWNEIRVAPGLGKGYNADGGAGFNSGMEARQAWLPKTVNQLRVDTNPKMTFGLDGHQGPANAAIKEAGTIKTQGRVEKYAPDTYYSVGPDRWFTTTGLEKAQTARGIEVLQHQNRPETACEYFGGGVREGEAAYVKGEFRGARRPQLDPNDITNPSAVGHGSATTGDYGVQSYQSLPNNRATTKQASEFGAVSGLVKAVVAPLFDVLRPSRKENVIGNLRPNGNAGTTVSNLPVYNPSDRTRTTIREMTEGAADGKYMNIEAQKDGGYLVAKQRPVTNQRDTTNCDYTGNAGPHGRHASQTYDAAYRQRNNPNKTIPNRPNQGGTQIFNQNDNISIQKRDADRANNRSNMHHAGPSVIPSTDTYGKINAPQYYNECQGCDRINPDILTAFKNNPYTQSLNSWS